MSAPTPPWFTAAELAGLAGMPGSEFRTRAKLDKLGVPSRLREGRAGGGGREFDSTHLPAETRAALLLQAIEPTCTKSQTVAASPAPLDSVTNSSLTLRATPAVIPASQQDTACADARAVLVRVLADMAPLCGGITRAAQQLAQQLTAGVAAPSLLATARQAHQRARHTDAGAPAGVPLSVRTLFGWHTAHAQGGWHALLPEPTRAPAAATFAPDVTAVLQRYASTAGSSRNLTHVAQAINLELGRPYDDWRSLYDRARRALPKLDRARLIKARHKGADRAALLPFKRRDASMFKPLDIGVCDGHSFKAKVRHPESGAPFTPEVTLVMDVYSRAVTGWSVSLSESTIAVGDAMRRSVEQHGIYALMYTDNGSGQSAKRLDCDVTGLYARLGTEHRTGRPRNPQARGVIERSWQSHMLKAARQFATYSGKDVDSDSYTDMALELAREQRAVKRAAADGTVVRLSAKCPSWQQFMAAVEDAVREYNTLHRHRSLPKHASGPYAGLHMTPAEAFESALVPSDVQRLDAVALRNVFMPAIVRTAIKGEVRFLNQVYFSHDLVQYEGQQVRVHYDIRDPRAVWIWSVSGQFICEALFGANTIEFFPRAVIDMAREKRVQAAIKRREAQIETHRAELRTTVDALQAPGAGNDLPVYIGDEIAAPIPAEPLLEEPLQVVERVIEGTTPARPFFDSTAHRYEWLMQHPAAWAEGDAAWLAAYAESDDYQALQAYFASRGIAWSEGDGDSSFNQAG